MNSSGGSSDGVGLSSANDERPRNYPTGLERDIQLTNGPTVHVRPILPGDGERLRQTLAHTDPYAARALLGARLTLDEAAVRHLTEVDYLRRLALVAVAPDGQGVAVGRYDADPQMRVAHVVVVVNNEWRRLGLATILLKMLGEAAVRVGVERFHAIFLAENRAAERLLRASGFPYGTVGSEEVLEAEVELVPSKR